MKNNLETLDLDLDVDWTILAFKYSNCSLSSSTVTLKTQAGFCPALSFTDIYSDHLWCRCERKASSQQDLLLPSGGHTSANVPIAEQIFNSALLLTLKMFSTLCFPK